MILKKKLKQKFIEWSIFLSKISFSFLALTPLSFFPVDCPYVGWVFHFGCWLSFLTILIELYCLNLKRIFSLRKYSLRIIFKMALKAILQFSWWLARLAGVTGGHGRYQIFVHRIWVKSSVAEILWIYSEPRSSVFCAATFVYQSHCFFISNNLIFCFCLHFAFSSIDFFLFPSCWPLWEFVFVAVPSTVCLENPIWALVLWLKFGYVVDSKGRGQK